MKQLLKCESRMCLFVFFLCTMRCSFQVGYLDLVEPWYLMVIATTVCAIMSSVGLFTVIVTGGVGKNGSTVAVSVEWVAAALHAQWFALSVLISTNISISSPSCSCRSNVSAPTALLTVPSESSKLCFWSVCRTKENYNILFTNNIHPR